MLCSIWPYNANFYIMQYLYRDIWRFLLVRSYRVTKYVMDIIILDYIIKFHLLIFIYRARKAINLAQSNRINYF